MMRRPQVALLSDGRRLHLQDGPIDLIIEAWGDSAAIAKAYRAAETALTGLLDTLCAELPALRQQAHPGGTPLQGHVARRMYAAVEPFAASHFMTPMAAVAGAVAEDVLAAMTKAAELNKVYVNNGGDIALHLAPGEELAVGLVSRPDQLQLLGRARIIADDATRGVATSGWRGRSFSFGIADAVTVLAATAAAADAAATIIANAVDLPGHPAIMREPACDLQPDSDLGERAVTRAVGPLRADKISLALDAGERCARDLLAGGLINGAALHLQDTTRVVALRTLLPPTRTESKSPAKVLLHA